MSPFEPLPDVRDADDAQVGRALRLDAIGRLAGGIAHDFNNLLTVVGVHTAFLLEELDPGSPLREDALAIREAAERATRLTGQLLAFGRRQFLRPQPTELMPAVRAACRMLGHLPGAPIDVRNLLPERLPMVLADPAQVAHVVASLAENAREAVQGGGSVEFRARGVQVSEETPKLRALLADGAYVELAVCDTGVGMDEAVLARLFEPFFSTKPAGHGTELGLATIYGIVRQSGGTILVESAPGAGSTFRVYLPAAPAAGDVVTTGATTAPAASGETILLVEDDASVRLVARRLLSRMGFVVLEAADGDEALALAAPCLDAIALVVTDAAMPRMNGVDVILRLREGRPALPALVMSGYSDSLQVRGSVESLAVPFLQKPFSPAAFEDAVRGALAVPASRGG